MAPADIAMNNSLLILMANSVLLAKVKALQVVGIHLLEEHFYFYFT